MPTTSEHRPAPKEEPKAEAKAEPKSKKSDPSALADELEALKAQGNPDPDRLAELKKQLTG